MKNILIIIGLIIFLIASLLLFVIYFNYDNSKEDAKDRFKNNYYMFGYWSAYCLYMMGGLVLGLAAFSVSENE